MGAGCAKAQRQEAALHENDINVVWLAGRLQRRVAAGERHRGRQRCMGRGGIFRPRWQLFSHTSHRSVTLWWQRKTRSGGDEGGDAKTWQKVNKEEDLS